MKINPLEIKEKDLPLIVFSDDRRGFLSWLIKSHSSGNYNHVMEMHRPCFFASQHYTGYKEIPVEKYMKASITLKFWKYRDLTKLTRERWIDAIEADLNAPWHKKRYDFLGLVGQILGKIHPIFRKINNPWIRYCSERLAHRMREILYMIIPLHPNPGELNSICKENVARMEMLGHWFED